MSAWILLKSSNVGENESDRADNPAPVNVPSISAFFAAILSSIPISGKRIPSGAVNLKIAKRIPIINDLVESSAP